MYTTTRVAIALCLALTVCSTMAAPKPNNQKSTKVEVAMPPQGLVMDLLLRSRDTHKPLAKVKIDINEKNKKLVLSLIPDPPPEVLPTNTLEDRAGILVGTCPDGYTKVGELCYIESDEDY